MSNKQIFSLTIFVILIINFLVTSKLPFQPSRYYSGFLMYVFFPGVTAYFYYLIYKNKSSYAESLDPSDSKLYNFLVYFFHKYLSVAIGVVFIGFLLSYAPCLPTQYLSKRLPLEKCELVEFKTHGRDIWRLYRLNLRLPDSNKDLNIIWPKNRVRPNVRLSKVNSCQLQRNQWLFGTYVLKINFD